jgi:hypothetical protein
MPKKINELPAATAAETNAVVAADNAAGTQTEKVTLAQIAALAGNVSSTTINTIVTLTETAYNDLTEKDATTMYIVTPNP